MQPIEMQFEKTREPKDYLYIQESTTKMTSNTFITKQQIKTLITTPVDFDGSFGGGGDVDDDCF